MHSVECSLQTGFTQQRDHQTYQLELCRHIQPNRATLDSEIIAAVVHLGPHRTRGCRAWIPAFGWLVAIMTEKQRNRTSRKSPFFLIRVSLVSLPLTDVGQAIRMSRQVIGMSELVKSMSDVDLILGSVPDGSWMIPG
mgnify:CR=1 FL=1